MDLEAGLGEALRTDYFLLRGKKLGAAGLVTMELNRGDGILHDFHVIRHGVSAFTAGA